MINNKDISNNKDLSNNIHKFFFNNIKDISNSLFKLPPININSKITTLHGSKYYKYNKFPTINKKVNKTINKNDLSFNLTINNILDSMKNKRKIKKNIYWDNFTKELDTNSNVFTKKPENRIVKYNYKKNDKYFIKKYFNEVENDYNKLNRTSNLFKYHTTDNLFTNTRSRTTNIYIPPNKSPLLYQPSIKKELVNIDVEINNLEDLIKLAEKYPLKFDVEYNINMEAIHNIKKPVTELNNMIGMNKLKSSILDQILYFVQEFHTQANSQDFMHTVIYGPPGTGKTETAKIMGKIFSNLGILKKKTFTKATRADLIAGYLGQTALKTRDMIEKSIGGVLFIDEAYALGNPEKRDSFAKECIDTLCEGLSDNKDKLMVIIAGYEKELKNCFFAYNQGLDSRFTWRFNTDDYTYKELFLIFKKKVNEIGWTLDDSIKNKWFKEKMDYFTYFGRDIETLLAKTKIAHGRRVFCLKKEDKMKITVKDLEKGFEAFLDNNEVKERKEGTAKNIIKHMYL